MSSLGGLNPQQRQAVETIHGPLLILAGAGTGKTRVITQRVGHLINCGVSPENILAVTFTNKAAREMRERVHQVRNVKRGGRSQDAAAKPTICTFHSLCVRILRQHIEKLGYKRNFVIYDESEQISAVKKILARISAKGEKLDPPAILAQLSFLKNGAERAVAMADEGPRAVAAHIRQKYESALRACNAVDFDDLILLTLRLFAEQLEALEACRQKYRYVMVDEYQDTNAAQFKLVHALTTEHRNLCVVGDDDQSIYGWRGAEVANLLNLEKHFPEVKVVKLEQNYRSTNTILSAANAIIQHNLRRREKRLWSQKGDGPKILLHTFADEEQEGRTIAEQIQYEHLTHRLPLASHAILFRTNAQSRPLEMALRQQNLRYHLIGGQSFFDRREVRDFLAYLKIFVNPNDDVSLLRIANMPARGLSETTMERLLSASRERNCAVFEVMKNQVELAAFTRRSLQSIELFAQFIEKTRAALNNEATQSGFLTRWANSWLDEIGYFEELRRSEKTAEAAEGRIRNLQDLIGTLDRENLPSSPVERLESFLEEITLDTEREEEEENTGDAITLITMHSCKGLEFPHVHIVGMEEGLLPHSRSEDQSSLDEERRLFYVAITRAMQSLSISHCGGRKKYGKVSTCRPSRFLEELPPELVEHADQKGKQPVAADSGKVRFEALRATLG
jgi:DNA helicase-2/ATP-dependent DNA helicase PcrA